MDDAVYKFKRYENTNLVYSGLNKHAGENIGLYETTLSLKEYEEHLLMNRNTKFVFYQILYLK